VIILVRWLAVKQRDSYLAHFGARGAGKKLLDVRIKIHAELWWVTRSSNNDLAGLKVTVCDLLLLLTMMTMMKMMCPTHICGCRGNFLRGQSHS
jgi:hypothetical protein